MLHGRDGPERFAHAYAAAARALVAYRYHVLFLRYFEATDDHTLFSERGLAKFSGVGACAR
jgi:hypothetical protein